MASVQSALDELTLGAFPGLFEPLPIPFKVFGPTRLPDDVRLDVLLRQSDALRAFHSSASKDQTLRQVYEQGVQVRTDLGSGWMIQPELLPVSIVASAARRRLLACEDVGDREALLHDVRRGLRQARRLLRGETVKASILTGVGGIEFSDAISVATPWGTMRSRRPDSPRADATREGGFSVVIEKLVETSASVGKPQSVAPIARERLVAVDERAVERLLPLAVLLAIKREHHYAASEVVWRTTLFPMQPGYGSSGGGRFHLHRPKPTVLQATDIATLQRWFELVCRYYDPTIEIAAGRVMSAIRERTQLEDSLIDAAIVTENLFGHGGRDEVGFRVSSATALLLESDPSKRFALRKLMGEVYSSRSTVVHGGQVSRKTLQSHAAIAIRIAVDSLRTLFEERCDLVSERDRGMQLILGSPREGKRR